MAQFYQFYPELNQCIIESKEAAIKWFEGRYTINGRSITDNVMKITYATVYDFKCHIMPIRIISGKKLISAGNFFDKYYFRSKQIERDLFAA